MFDIRLEGIDNDGGAIQFNGRSEKCTIEKSWASSNSNLPIAELSYTDNGNSNLIYDTDDSAYNVHPAFYLNADSILLDNNSTPTKANIYGVGTWTGIGETDTPTDPIYITKLGRSISVPSFKVICRTGLIPVSRTGDSWVLIDSLGWSSGGYRVLIWGYDIDGNLLPSSSNDLTVPGVGDVGFGALYSTNRTEDSRALVTRSNCAFVSIAVTGGSGTNTFKDLSVAIRNPSVSINANSNSKRLSGAYAIPFNTPNI